MQDSTVGGVLTRQRRFAWRVYSELARREKDSGLRRLLSNFAEKEQKSYESMLRMFPNSGTGSGTMEDIHVGAFVFSRKVFGIAFTSKLLERSRRVTAESCASTLKRIRDHSTERGALMKFTKGQSADEDGIGKDIKEYETQLEYVRSIVFGLNDGLVELLAAVAGLAVLSNSSLVVVLGGIVIGVSGTLSMAGGAYLSSKSEDIVDKLSSGTRTKPSLDALYTGVYYFLGALVPIIPFLIGLQGYVGIITAIVLVCLVLTLASVIIAVIGGRSIKRRVAEMLLISLGAAFATIILGTVLRSYGLTI